MGDLVGGAGRGDLGPIAVSLGLEQLGLDEAGEHLALEFALVDGVALAGVDLYKALDAGAFKGANGAAHDVEADDVTAGAAPAFQVAHLLVTGGVDELELAVAPLVAHRMTESLEVGVFPEYVCNGYGGSVHF